VLLFLAMVVTGLLLVLVLSDPFEGRSPAVIGELDAQSDAEGQVKILHPDEPGETLISFGEVEFDVLQLVELGDGRSEERTVYRVHMQSGRSDDSGAFLATQPEIHLLDHATGEETGVVRADRARFETGGSVAGSVTIDFGRLRADNLELSGNVDGRFPLADGTSAHLQALSLQLRGGVVSAPGLVTWTRGDLSVTGIDMRWDEARGRLDLTREARLSMEPLDDRVGHELTAPGGLTWVLQADADDPQGESWLELRGGVTGRSTDGSSLQAQRVEADGSAQRLRLSGAADVALAGSDPPLRFRSDELLVESVRDGAALSVTATGPIDWSQGELRGEGVGLHWDGVLGRLIIDRAGRFVLPDPEGGAPWTLQSGGRLEWFVATEPGGTGQGELDGGVIGEVPGVGSFSAEHVALDGDRRSLALLGDAHWEWSDGERSLVMSAERRLGVSGDETGQPVLLEAEGSALALITPPGAIGPTRLAAETLVLDRVGRRARLVGTIRIERPGEVEPLKLTADEWLELQTDENDELVRVEAHGAVEISQRYLARGDQLTWDVEADEALLVGSCWLAAEGAWMNAERIEVHPRARTFRILRSTLGLNG
jgi:hypothetical protein